MQNRIVHDEELILRLQRGDEWVFQLLVRRFCKKVFSTAFGITLDVQASEKILKEVFQKVYDGAGSFDGEISINALLYRITVQRCFHWRRRWARRYKWRHVSENGAKRLNPTLPDKEVSNSPGGSDLVNPEVQAKIQNDIENTIKLLPEAVRTVYVLRETEGLSHEEIADVFGVRVGVVRTRMLHARKRLYKLLQPVKEG